MVEPVLDRLNGFRLYSLCSQSFEGVGKFWTFGRPVLAFHHLCSCMRESYSPKLLISVRGLIILREDER